MSTKQSLTYLGICGRLEPPLIGIYYKTPKQQKKKVYTILLQRLVLNPNVEEVVEQLYREHPHILKVDKISKDKIANVFAKIQAELNMGEHQYDDDYEEHEEEEHEEPHLDRPGRMAAKFQFEEEEDQEENYGRPARKKSL